MSARPEKITFGGAAWLIYCADYRCSHSVAVMADQWVDDVRLSDIEDRFTCSKRGADFNWNRRAWL
jgi:hypothetical protein